MDKEEEPLEIEIILSKVFRVGCVFLFGNEDIAQHDKALLGGEWVLSTRQCLDSGKIYWKLKYCKYVAR